MKKNFVLPLSLVSIAALVLLVWLCFAPGYMSYDSVVQYQSALEGHYTDSHPAIMSYIWHLCMLVIPGPQSLLYLHLAMLAFGIFIWQINCKDTVSRFLIPALFLLPWVMNFVGVLWKDVGMALSLLVATGLLFTRGRNILLAFLAIPFIFYAFGVRHNAIIAVVPILFLAIKYHFPKLSLWKTIFITISLTAVFSVAVYVVTYKFIDAERKHYETLLMGDDIAEISTRTNQNLLPWIKAEDLEVCTVPHILYERALCFISKGYDPSGSLVVNLPFEETHSLWERTILANPLEYVSVRLESFLYFLRPDVLQPFYTRFTGIAQNEHNIQLFYPRFANILEKYMIATQNTVLSELFKPYVWVLMAMVMLLWASRRSNSFERTQIIVLNISALGCFASLLIAVPSVDFRYIYWCVIATTLSFVIMLSTYRDLPLREESN